MSYLSDLIVENRFAPIEHIFGNHRFCTGQCPGKKRALEKAKAAAAATAATKETTFPTDAKETIPLTNITTASASAKETSILPPGANDPDNGRD